VCLPKHITAEHAIRRHLKCSVSCSSSPPSGLPWRLWWWWFKCQCGQYKGTFFSISFKNL